MPTRLAVFVLVVVPAFAGLLAACGTRAPATGAAAAPARAGAAAGALNDGELALPGGYRSWTKPLETVHRPDAKQVREIYMNPAARSAPAGGMLPNGSVFVMENYAAAANPDGSLKLGADGKLVKGELQRIFVMGKGAGWGQAVPEGLRNGNWVYAAYLPNGQRSDDNLLTCRACHLSQAQKDFLFRHDEYFGRRSPALRKTVPDTLAQPWRPDDAVLVARLAAAN
jgi:hypothetical protein